MSDLKKFELEVSATAFDGSQTFACLAKDEFEAAEKFKLGECEIIDVNVEVIGLEKEPFSIEESADISSRLPSDILFSINKELSETKRQRDALLLMANELVDLLKSIGNDYGAEDTQDAIDSIMSKDKGGDNGK